MRLPGLCTAGYLGLLGGNPSQAIEALNFDQKQEIWPNNYTYTLLVPIRLTPTPTPTPTATPSTTLQIREIRRGSGQNGLKFAKFRWGFLSFQP